MCINGCCHLEKEMENINQVIACRLGNLNKEKNNCIQLHWVYIYILTEPVGYIVLYKLYKDNDIPINENYEGIMLSAIISNTILLRSQTTT